MTLANSSEKVTRTTATSNIKAPLNQAFHLPGDYYSSAEVYALEKTKIFMQDWLCVGRVEEVENVGDYMAFHVLGEPVLVARDKNGNLNAFCNTCRHRGVEVAQGQGNAKEFSCPYHGWLYDLSGKLIGSPYMKQHTAFDPADCRLKPLGLDQWAGWIFVTFNPDPPPLAEFVAEYEKAFGLLRMQDCRLSSKFDLDLECNWKLVVENLQDVYHFQTLHVDSFGAHLSVDENFDFDVKEKGGFSSFYTGAPDTPDGKTLVGKLPWLEDKPMNLAYSGYLAPNFHVFGRIDEIHPMVVWPLSPNRTKMVVYHLFAADHHRQPGFAEKAVVYRDFIARVLEEDRTMVASLQRAMKTKAFEPGPMSHMEVNLHNLINYTAHRIYGE